MQQDEKLFYGIKDVAQKLGFENESAVRYYVDFFHINIPKRAGKLAFREKDIEKIRKIANLTKQEGYKLEAAKKTLRKKEEKSTSTEEILLKLQNIKRILVLLNDKINS